MSTDTTDRRLVALVLIALGVLVFVPALGMGVGLFGRGHMWGGMWGDGAVPVWLFLVGAGMQLLFLLALAGGAYLLYRAVAGGEGGAADSGEDEAIRELRVAYARGELDDEEFERRRERLEREP